MQMYTPSLCIVGKENIIKIDYKLNKADIILDILEQPQEMSSPRSRHMNRVFTHTAKKSNDTSQVSFRHNTTRGHFIFTPHKTIFHETKQNV